MRYAATLLSAYTIAFLGTFLSCSVVSDAVSRAEAPQAACVETPPEEYGPGYLLDCTSQDTKTCCGYGFMIDGWEKLCFLVLCRMEECDAFEYHTAFCPGAEPTHKSKDASQYDAKDDEGWEADI